MVAVPVVSLTSQSSSLRHDAAAIIRAGIADADPARLLSRALDASPLLAGREPLALVAAGKAAVPMARRFLEVAANRCRHALVVTNEATDGAWAAFAEATASKPPFVRAFTAGHPTPNVESVAAGHAALELAASIHQDESLVVLLSGGASALLAAPQTGISLDEKITTTRGLLASGVPIHDINCVRKHLSAIKGGRLAATASGATHTFALSDIVGPNEDDPTVLGSGPTVPDETTFDDALAVLARAQLTTTVPPSVLRLLKQGADGSVEETPKAGDPRLSRSSFQIIGTRRDAMEGARREAARRGYTPLVVEAAITGEARLEGPGHVARALELAQSLPKPCCIIASGETTVRVVGGGKGGRNQEFVLGALGALPSDQRILVASVGTDGIDGPTDAAGALGDAETLSKARALNLPERTSYLNENNAYAFFDAVGDLVKTGPTGTNVVDLQIVLVA